MCFTFAKYAHIFCWSFEFWVGIWTLIAIVGDITPSNGVPKQEKSRLEQAALNEMCEVLGGGLTVTQILTLAILTFSIFSFEFSGTKYFHFFSLRDQRVMGWVWKQCFLGGQPCQRLWQSLNFWMMLLRNRSMVPNASYQLIFLLLQCAVKVIETQDSIQIKCVYHVCHISSSTFELLMTSLLEKLQGAFSD